MKEYQVKVFDDRTEWYQYGKLHRKNGPAVEYNTGTKVWYLDGNRHREGGPAYEGSLGIRAWYKHGLIHREDGPAYETDDGDKEFWLNGEKYFELDFVAEMNPKSQGNIDGKIVEIKGKKYKLTAIENT